MNFGVKSGAGEFRGTVIFPERLIMDILLQSCKEIARNGFKKIVIINHHGGNTALLNTFARSLLNENYDFLVYIYPPHMPLPKLILSELGNYPYLTEEDKEVLRTYKGKREGHAGFTEAGLVLDVAPELCRLDKMDKLDGKTTGLFSEFARHQLYTPLAWMGNFPNSFEGDMHYGMNERIARAMGECSVGAMARMFGFLKEETVSTQYHREWVKKNFG
jgi:creatinine amidohydrolase